MGHMADAIGITEMAHTCGSVPLSWSESTSTTREGKDDDPRVVVVL